MEDKVFDILVMALCVPFLFLDLTQKVKIDKWVIPNLKPSV